MSSVSSCILSIRAALSRRSHLEGKNRMGFLKPTRFVSEPGARPKPKIAELLDQ